jgi:hypothetical protein
LWNKWKKRGKEMTEKPDSSEKAQIGPEYPEISSLKEP